MVGALQGVSPYSAYAPGTSGRKDKEALRESFLQLLGEKKSEAYERIAGGRSEPSIQTGAASYTDSEWKRLLRGFDAVEEKLREATKAANGIKKEKTKQSDAYAMAEGEGQAKNIDMLFAEFTTAQYASDSPGEKVDRYYTYYLPDGIYCKKEGESGYEWHIPFEDASEYEKVMDFLRDFDSRENMTFASHENFWSDFLSDKVDMDRFRVFLDTRVVDGVPNYLNEYENGIAVDEEAASYSKYMNSPSFVSILSQKDLTTPPGSLKSKDVGHEVIDLNRVETYYAYHPDEIGKRNQYYNGQWYTWAELAPLIKKEVEELFNSTSRENKSSPEFDSVRYSAAG